jgi:nitrite reductase/ring-hydroxylating ferredoxin subunit
MFPNASCQWVPVALSADIPRLAVVPGWLPGLEIALWRSASGRIAASSNRCPHRGMRLSHGFVRGEKLSCIYHGWSFGPDGTCVRIPAHPDLTPPATITSQNKTVVEVGGLVWVCDGNANSPPPEFHGLKPVRSLTVDASPEALDAVTDIDTSGTGLRGATVAGVRMQLVLAPLPGAQTLVHVLVSANSTLQDRIAVARAAEGLRRRAEALSQSRDAA